MKHIQSFENFLNEALSPDELESQVRDITFLFRQHNRGVKGKHSDKQIVDFMKKYGFDQKLTSKQKDEVFDLVKKNLNEALRPDELESLANDLAYSIPNHTKYDESEGPSDKQIMDAMKKYQKDLYQYSTKKQKDEVLDIVKKILNESSINEESDQARLTYFRNLGIAPNNQPQNAAYIKQVLKPGKFFVDWKDVFGLGAVALEFVKQVTSISEFDIIDLKTMKKTGEKLDVKKGQLGYLRTTYGVTLIESSINEEYIELMQIDEPLEMLKQAWEQWRKGPMTEYEDVSPAHKELLKYVQTWLKKNLR